MVKLMTWIIASKAKLHKLISEYMSLPQLKYTNFTESPCRTCYYLEWSTEGGNDYRAYYTIKKAAPVLIIQIKKKRSTSYRRLIEHKLNFKNLSTKGLTKNIQRESTMKAILLNQQLYAMNI